MSQHREFSCNVCQTRMGGERAERHMEGIHFTGMREWRGGRAKECETHICHNCLGLAKKLYDSLAEGGFLLPEEQ